MSKYLVIIAAVFVGVLIGMIMARLKSTSAANETVYVDKRPPINLIPYVAGIAVLLIGFYLISDGTRAPISSEYKPASLENGVLKPGQFDEGGE